MKLILGDCLEKLRDIPDGTIDMVLADLPYGTTACKWDTCIPFEPLWAELHRVCKQNAAMVMFGSEPFSSLMRISNLKRFKYDWYLEKNRATGFLNAKRQPLYKYELCSVFSGGKINYNPQVRPCKPTKMKTNNTGSKSDCYGKIKWTKPTYAVRDFTYPDNRIEFRQVLKNRQHPTQKPVAVLEYLIKTYTNEGDTVLDPTMGSGSTGVACKNLGRNFIGIEKLSNYFEIAKKRIAHEIT